MAAPGTRVAAKRIPPRGPRSTITTRVPLRPVAERPIDRVHSPAAPALPILMYHNIARAPRGLPAYRSLYVSPGAFARQLWLLRRLGYAGVSMAAAMPYLHGERSGRVVVMTLDDGYVDNLEAALPLLQRFGFTATVYVVSGALGRFNRWDAERLGIRK